MRCINRLNPPPVAEGQMFYVDDCYRCITVSWLKKYLFTPVAQIATNC